MVPLKLLFDNNVEDNVVFLVWEVFYSNNFFIISQAENTKMKTAIQGKSMHN